MVLHNICNKNNIGLLEEDQEFRDDVLIPQLQLDNMDNDNPAPDLDIERRNLIVAQFGI